MLVPAVALHFLNPTLRSLAGQRLPEVRQQLNLTRAEQELETTQATTTRHPRNRTRAELEAQAAQLGLMAGLS